jgi:hypothetical protein
MAKIPTRLERRRQIDEVVAIAADAMPEVQAGEIEILRQGRNIVVRNVRKTNNQSESRKSKDFRTSVEVADHGRE